MPGAWWSVMPSNWRSAERASVVAQACVQVEGVRADIAADAAALGPERLLRIEYEDLCAQPAETLARVESFLRSRGVRVETRGELPMRFTASRGAPLADPDEQELARCLGGDVSARR